MESSLPRLPCFAQAKGHDEGQAGCRERGVPFFALCATKGRPDFNRWWDADMNANTDSGISDHGLLGLARMTEAETEWFIVLIRAGHGLRGTMFPVKEDSCSC